MNYDRIYDKTAFGKWHWFYVIARLLPLLPNNMFSEWNSYFVETANEVFGLVLY